MPELPEAETIAAGLRGPVIGRWFSRIEVLRPDLLEAAPDEFSAALQNAVVLDISRRGKNLVLTIGRGAGPRRDQVLLVINLGMSGRLLHRRAADRSPPPSHPGIRFHLDDHSLLVYHDVRRFGRLVLKSPTAYLAWSRTLGPEPLSRGFTGSSFSEALAGSRTPIRSWLMDQKRIAGIGNIYANEALSRAGIHPQKPSAEVRREEALRLHRAVRSVLRAAVIAKGTTLRDYRTAAGSKGSYAPELRVYGKAGSPCTQCGHPIERLIFGGRSAFFCRNCQPPTGSVR